eukprot:CCRYP_007224-RA/>CCRYP_007224-RA protein AED:0.34 eAED:0.32 QI:0/0/0/1/0/0/2/0/496
MHYCAAHIARKRQLLASSTAMSASTSNAFLTEDNTNLTEGTFAQLDGYLDNLAAAATTERTTLQSLTEANAALVANVTALTTSVASLTATYNTMTAIHRTGSTPPIAPTQQPRRTRTNTRHSTTLPTMPGGYCWTHRFWVREGNSSLTCGNKAEGHKDAATQTNTMGGSMGGQVDAAALSIVTNTFPIYNIFTTASSYSPPYCSDLAIADTGASGQYFLPQAPHQHQCTRPPTTIRTATGQPLFSTGTATINLPSIPPGTRHGHIVPGLTHNLISISTLCDAGCTAHFTADTLTITEPADTVILSGTRDMHAPRLWQINLAPPQHSLALHIARARPTRASTTRAQPPPTHLKKTPMENLHPLHNTDPTTTHRVHTHLRTHDLPTTRALVAFLHATAGYPVKSTWLQAIKNRFYNSWPGLTYTLVAKFCPNADATIQGHMAQPQQHIRSTTSTTTHPPPLPTLPQQAIDLFTIPLNKIFTDDTDSSILEHAVGTNTS